MSEEVKLYGTWASPYSRRVELALKIKGVLYEYIEEDLRNKSPELLKYNPVHKKIPVLVHNGKPIAESLVILEYIDDTWPNPPIMPKDPYDRARVRFWAKFVDETILPTAVRSFKPKNEEMIDRQIIEEVRQQLKFLENELAEKEFFGGKVIGYLDILVFYLIYYYQLSKEVFVVEVVPEKNFPLLSKFVEKLLNMDVVKECLPPRDKHVAFMKIRMEEAKAAAAAAK